MTKKALLLGYGFAAQSIDRVLSNRGYQTFGVRRNWEDRESENVSSRMLEADITDPATFETLPSDPDLVVNCVSAGARGDAERYRTVYYEGTKNILDWASDKSLDLLLWTGSSSVYGEHDGEAVDESSELKPKSEAGEILIETETLYRESDLPATILRVTGIYGPGRARTLRRVESGSLSLSLDEANNYMNMIHRRDLGRAIGELADRPHPGEVFNVVDNEPVTKRTFYVWLSQQLDKPLPKLTGGGRPTFGNKQVSNQKLVSTFNFEFEFPTYREGYREILENRSSESPQA